MPELPIEQHLASIEDALDTHSRLILVAQPGAGKTTRVPLRLIERPWARGQRLLMLEPRRVAARLAATYMAAQLGEPVGKRIGYRMRGDQRVGPDTQLEVITQGVLTRMLQDDPLLEGVAGILFDEFHERSIESDLGLALALDVQQSIRDDLRLVVMSATLDIEALRTLLGEHTPVIESSGRAFPVTTLYRPPVVGETTAMTARSVVEEAVALDDAQDILVILPGVAEIRRLAQVLASSTLTLDIRTLHGGMTLDAQQAALSPGTQRRVIISTSITESSLTVDGVNVVIDAGLERVPEFSAQTGLTRLTTRRVNRASAGQRRGRAGRQQSGYCYRLWAQDQPLVAHREPEMLQADLSRLALELALWGVNAPDALAWLSPPPRGAWQSARDLLQRLGLLDQAGGLTPLGQQCGTLPVEPRLAAMLVRSKAGENTALACALAALLEGRERLEGTLQEALVARLKTPSAFPTWHQEAKRLAVLMGCTVPSRLNLEPLEELLAVAFPDRVAQLMNLGRFKLANGKTATLSPQHPLANEPYLVAVHLDSASRDAPIQRAVPLSEQVLRALYPATATWHERVAWQEPPGKLVADAVQCHGELVLAVRPLQTLPAAAAEKALMSALQRRPAALLNDEVRRLQGRMALLERTFPGQWPDWSDAALVDDLEAWLAPYVAGMTRLGQVEKLPFAGCLLETLTWEAQSAFARLVPTGLRAPSGNTITLDYLPCLESRPPVLALKLQEAFGWQETPTVAEGQVAVMIHLLSPARRPLQVTQDLRSFWLTGYPEVRKEMRGRYPKHPWPEDPLSAQATALTKRRLGNA